MVNRIKLKLNYFIKNFKVIFVFLFLGCLFIELIMISENLLTKTINITDPDLENYYSARDGTEKEIPNSINYIYFKDVKEGRYSIFSNYYQEYYISGGKDWE